MRILFALAAAGLFGCVLDSSTSATTITPITGIVLRSDSLVAGLGCGRSPGQVYRYAAVVTNIDAPDGPRPSGLFDCFADGAFVNLPASPNGNQAFRVDVLAFSASDYDTWNANGALVQAAANATTLLSFSSTWRTSCTATQQQNIVVLAVCGPLVGVDGGVTDAGDAGDAGDASDASDASSETGP